MDQQIGIDSRSLLTERLNVLPNGFVSITKSARMVLFRKLRETGRDANKASLIVRAERVKVEYFFVPFEKSENIFGNK